MEVFSFSKRYFQHCLFLVYLIHEYFAYQINTLMIAFGCSNNCVFQIKLISIVSGKASWHMKCACSSLHLKDHKDLFLAFVAFQPVTSNYVLLE